MPWRYAMLRGARVLARCDAAGALSERGGRVEIRYSPKAKKAYQAGKRNLALDGEQILPDETCVEVDSEQATTKKATTKKATTKKKKGASRKPVPADEPIPDHAVVAYTDGACSGNPGPAGLGVVLCMDGQQRECCRYLGTATNNIAELTAIGVAAEAVQDPTRPVRIYTDSSYAIGVLTKGWNAKANKSLIAELKAALARLQDVRLIHVRGHAGVPLNERADQLAVSAVQTRQSCDWQVVATTKTPGPPPPT